MNLHSPSTISEFDLTSPMRDPPIRPEEPPLQLDTRTMAGPSPSFFRLPSLIYNDESESANMFEEFPMQNSGVQSLLRRVEMMDEVPALSFSSLFHEEREIHKRASMPHEFLAAFREEQVGKEKTTALIEGPPDASTTRLLYSCLSDELSSPLGNLTRTERFTSFKKPLPRLETPPNDASCEVEDLSSQSLHTPIESIYSMQACRGMPSHASFLMTPQRSSRRSFTRLTTSMAQLHGPLAGPNLDNKLHNVDFLLPNRNPYSPYRGFRAVENIALLTDADWDTIHPKSINGEVNVEKLRANACVAVYEQTIPPQEASCLDCIPVRRPIVLHAAKKTVLLFNISSFVKYDDDGVTNSANAVPNEDGDKSAVVLSVLDISHAREIDQRSLPVGKNNSFRMDASTSIRSIPDCLDASRFGKNSSAHVEDSVEEENALLDVATGFRPSFRPMSAVDASPSSICCNLTEQEFSPESHHFSATRLRPPSSSRIVGTQGRRTSQRAMWMAREFSGATCFRSLTGGFQYSMTHEASATPEMKSYTYLSDSLTARQQASLEPSSLVLPAHPERDLDTPEDERFEIGEHFRNHHRYQFLHWIPWRKQNKFVPLNIDRNGIIWLATHRVNGLPYAVKEVPGSFRASLQTELECLTLGNAPKTPLQQQAADHIVRFYTVFPHSAVSSCEPPDNVVFLIQCEYFPRGSVLERALDPYHLCGEPYKVPPESFWRCVLQHGLLALEALHAAHIVHGNPIPSNIYMYAAHHFKLTNFGSSVKSPDAYPAGTLTNLLPEMKMSSATWTPYQVDAYVLCCGLLWLLLRCIEHRKLYECMTNTRGEAVKHLLLENMISFTMFKQTRSSGLHDLTDDLWYIFDALLHGQSICGVLKLMDAPSRSLWAARTLFDTEFLHLLHKKHRLQEQLKERRQRKKKLNRAPMNMSETEYHHREHSARIESSWCSSSEAHQTPFSVGRSRDTMQPKNQLPFFAHSVMGNIKGKAHGRDVSHAKAHSSPTATIQLPSGNHTSPIIRSLSTRRHFEDAINGCDSRGMFVRAEAHAFSTIKFDVSTISTEVISYLENAVQFADAQQMDESMSWIVKELETLIRLDRVLHTSDTFACARVSNQGSVNWKPLSSSEL